MARRHDCLICFPDKKEYFTKPNTIKMTIGCDQYPEHLTTVDLTISTASFEYGKQLDNAPGASL